MGKRKDRTKDYERVFANISLGRPTFEGVEKKIHSKELKEIEIKPTIKVYKVDMFIHKAEYRKKIEYIEARNRHDAYAGLDIIKFWYKWLERLCDERNCDVYELMEVAGKPRLLQYLRQQKRGLLMKLSLAHRFALILGEPFIPIYTEEELNDYQIPKTLYEKVTIVKTKRTKPAKEYGKVNEEKSIFIKRVRRKRQKLLNPSGKDLPIGLDPEDYLYLPQ